MIKRIPPLLLILMLTSIPHLIYVLIHWEYFPLSNGMDIGQDDPDSWLRLTLVRDWITSGNWYSHDVLRSNVPFGGISSPWTRPLDCVIALLASIQPETVELSKRLLRASLLLPWIWMTLLVWGIFRVIALRTVPRATFVMASVLVACTPIIWNYFSLGNADHHAPLAVLFIWVMSIILKEHPNTRATIAAGLMLGLSLWISVEALILIAAIYAWYGLAWLRDRPAPLMVLSLSTALMSAAALLIERPQSQWLRPVYDSISIVHVASLSTAAAVAICLQLLPRDLSLKKRIAYAVGCIFAALVALYAQYPLLFSGPMVEADPYIFTHFLPNITEAQSLLTAAGHITLANIFLPTIGLALCAMAWLDPKRAIYTKPEAEARLFFLGITFILYACQIRWNYYLLPLAVTVVAPFLGALFAPNQEAVRNAWPARLLANLPESAQARRRIPIMLAMIGTPLAIALVGSALFPKPLLLKQRKACQTFTHQLLYSGKLDVLMGMRPSNVLAPTDLATTILFWSDRMRIVASNYHREGPGIKYVWQAHEITDETKLRKHLAERNITHILACPMPKQIEGSILQGIVWGKKPPAWLKKIEYDTPPPEEGKISMPPVLLKVN